MQVHYSKQGQAFRSKAQSMHMEILQSPWLCELMAFHINLRETKVKSGKTPALFQGCYLTFNDGKPSLSCDLFDSIKLDIDLTCSICLVSYNISALIVGHFVYHPSINHKKKKKCSQTKCSKAHHPQLQKRVLKYGFTVL